MCDPNCYIASNNGSSNNASSNNGSSNSEAQPAYRLTSPTISSICTSTVDISLTTANGHTDQANLPTAGGLSYTFNIPENQGKSCTSLCEALEIFP